MESKQTKTKSPIIGVLGGVGPHAGADFFQKILANTRALGDQDHLNCVMISLPSVVSDRSAFLLRNEGENPALGMFESARCLYMAGARIAAVACNTAHAQRIFPLFCSMVKESLPDLQILNMLENCADYLKKEKQAGAKKSLGLLATIGTHKSGVYREYFKEEDGLFLLEPDAQGQQNIHEAIYNEQFGIKSQSQPVTHKAVDIILHEINQLVKQGAEAVILGCTELPLAVKNGSAAVPLIDPGLLAARKLIELVCPEKLLPM